MFNNFDHVEQPENFEIIPKKGLDIELSFIKF